MRNGKLCRRELLMTSTALAAGAMVMHPFDAFAQVSLHGILDGACEHVRWRGLSERPAQ